MAARETCALASCTALGEKLLNHRVIRVQLHKKDVMAALRLVSCDQQTFHSPSGVGEGSSRMWRGEAKANPMLAPKAMLQRSSEHLY